MRGSIDLATDIPGSVVCIGGPEGVGTALTAKSLIISSTTGSALRVDEEGTALSGVINV